MTDLPAPEVAMSAAERDHLIQHLVKLRDVMASPHPRIAHWANDRLIELADERDRQRAQFRRWSAEMDEQ